MVRRQDRRKHRRFYASVPIEFQVQAPKSVQLCISLGGLRNISYGGPTSLLILKGFDMRAISLKSLGLMFLAIALFTVKDAYALTIQTWNFADVGEFDTLETYMVSGNANLIASGFSSPGWSVSEMNKDYLTASGPLVTSLQGEVYYSSLNSKKEVVQDWLFYAGGLSGELVGSFRATYEGHEWTMSAIPGGTYNHDSATVPLPATGLLLGSGLIGMALLRRRGPMVARRRESWRRVNLLNLKDK
jgi:hypothetical protein